MAESEIKKLRTELSEALQFIDLLEKQQQNKKKDNDGKGLLANKYEQQMELPTIQEGPDDETLDYDDYDY